MDDAVGESYTFLIKRRRSSEIILLHVIGLYIIFIGPIHVCVRVHVRVHKHNVIIDGHVSGMILHMFDHESAFHFGRGRRVDLSPAM